MASILVWTGCSGSSSTEDAADQKPADNAPQKAGGAATQQQAAAGPSDKEKEPRPEPAGEAPFDTTFLDVETELFLFTRVGDVLDSSLVQMLMGGNLGPLNQLEQQLGVPAAEIDTVTIGVSQLAKLTEQSADSMSQMASLMGPQATPGMGTSPGGGGYDDTMDAGMDDAMMPDEDEEFLDSPDDPDGGGGGARPPQGSGKGVVAVVRTKSPIDLKRLDGKPEVQRVTHGKQAYYRVTAKRPYGSPASPAPEQACLYLHDPQTLVVTDEVTIKDIMEKGTERARPTADLGFLKTAPHILLAVVPKDKKALNEAGSKFEIPGGGLLTTMAIPGAAGAVTSQSSDQQYDAGDPVDDGTLDPDAGGAGSAGDSAEETLFAEHTEAFALLIDLSEGIGLNLSVLCDAEDAAQQKLVEIDRGVIGSKQQFEAMKSSLPGVVRLVAQPLMESLQVSAEGDVVTVSLALPQEQQAMLPMVPTALMGMMMGGMGSAPDGAVSHVPSLGEFAMVTMFEGQPAANTGELPEGLELKALMRWGRSPYGEQAPPPLEIGIVAKGGAAANAIALGQLNLAEVQANGTSLKWIGSLSDSPDQSPVSDLLRVDRDSMLSVHPDEAIVTGFVISPPADQVASLATVAGEFNLQIAGDVQEIAYPDVQDIQGSPATGSGLDKLDALQLKITSRSRGNYDELEVAYNDSPEVGRVELIGPGGGTITSAGGSTFNAGGRTTETHLFSGRMPPSTGLRITLYDNLQMVTVPFRFENLPVPPAPQLTADQQALLVWTPVEAPEEIDNLTIQAQGRWRQLERVEPSSQGFGAGFANQRPQPGFQSGGLDGTMIDDSGVDVSDDTGDLDVTEDAADAGIGGGGFAGGSGAQPGGPQGNGRNLPKSENPLRIVVDLIGPLARTAEAIGFVDVGSATSNIDTELTYEGAEFGSGESNPTRQFIELDRKAMSSEDHPPGGVRVVLKLTPPNQEIQAVARLNGSLKFKTVRERVDAIVPNLQTRLGKPFTSPDLTKVRIKPVAQIQGNRLMMRLVEGSEDRIAEVIPVDLNGLPIAGVRASEQTGGARAEGRTIYLFEFPGGVPEKFGLKFIINMGVEEITVPLRIRDLPLPPMPVTEQRPL